MTGIQKFIMAMTFGVIKEDIKYYCSLSAEEKEKIKKQIAIRMLNKALDGKLKKPYDEYEQQFIKETLGIEIPSK